MIKRSKKTVQQISYGDTMSDYLVYILNISCEDRIGIVASISGLLSSHDCFIEESSHFGDSSTNQFFMRTQFRLPKELNEEFIRKKISKLSVDLTLSWQLFKAEKKPNVIIMGSKEDHCVKDLLYRSKSNLLPMKVKAIISNHINLEEISRWYDIPFYYISTNNGKKEIEKKTTEVMKKESCELILLAKYMQILSPKMCELYSGNIINIHHSFLPSFKGSRPYQRAHALGVKLIGATAHYVTEHLDEGPIIAQSVSSVTHADSIQDLINLGKDIEAQTLARAVRFHLERRVFIHNNKTIVFKK